MLSSELGEFRNRNTQKKSSAQFSNRHFYNGHEKQGKGMYEVKQQL